jgi:hypothetical protein
MHSLKVVLVPALLVLIGLAGHTTAIAREWWVAEDGSADGDGTEENPLAAIQPAIDKAQDGDEVIVKPGVYSGDGNRDIELRGKAIIVRSRDGDPATCTISCDGKPSDPHRGFYIHEQETAGTVVSGFTITGGGGVTYGGGILIGEPWEFNQYDVSIRPVISNCIVREDSSSIGAGIAVLGNRPEPWLDWPKIGNLVWPEITLCRVEANAGSGILLDNGATALIKDCHVEENAGSGIRLAGTWTGNEEPVLVRRSFVSDNGEHGIDHHSHDGFAYGWVRLEQTEITRNAAWGIACLCYEDGGIILEDCIVSQNHQGGGQ